VVSAQYGVCYDMNWSTIVEYYGHTTVFQSEAVFPSQKPYVSTSGDGYPDVYVEYSVSYYTRFILWFKGKLFTANIIPCNCSLLINAFLHVKEIQSFNLFFLYGYWVPSSYID